MVFEIKTVDQAKSLAQAWMHDNGFSPSEFLPCPDDLNFMLQGTAQNGMPFLVIQQKKSERAVVAIANVRVTESSFASLSAMSKGERDAFLWDLKKELMFAPPTFSFDPSFEDTGIPKGFQFAKEVYYDELTEGRLAEAVNYAIRSALWVVWTFRRKFGAPVEVKSVE
ncbi:Uncharacterised protein [uncultured archaeon]|nr:Uncharacterised protein [uncultured archaeon]